MESFHPFAGIPGFLLGAQPSTSEFRVDSDGVFVRTPGTRIEINGEGVVVQRHDAPPIQNFAPDHHAGVKGAKLAVFPLLAIAVVGFVILMIASRTSRKLAIALLLLTAVVGFFGLASFRVSAPRPITMHEPHKIETLRWNHNAQTLVSTLEHPLPPIAAPAAPEAPAPAVVANVDDQPSPQPAASAPVTEDAAPKPALPDAKYTLYAGNSRDGVGIENPPAWVFDAEQSQPDFLGPQTLSSERFASIDEAEEQLWRRVESLAGDFLTIRHPQARGWRPSWELVREANLVTERCIEKSELVVNTFTLPMYRAHFRVQMTDPALGLMARAWQPTVTRERVMMAGGGIAAATGLFAALNLLFRGLSSSLWRRLTRRRTVAAAVAGGLLLAGLGFLIA